MNHFVEPINSDSWFMKEISPQSNWIDINITHKIPPLSTIYISVLYSPSFYASRIEFNSIKYSFILFKSPFLLFFLLQNYRLSRLTQGIKMYWLGTNLMYIRVNQYLCRCRKQKYILYFISWSIIWNKIIHFFFCSEWRWWSSFIINHLGKRQRKPSWITRNLC